MTALLHQFVVSLRLYFRNTMALAYGYLFPTIFLVAFWVLYRHEPVPLARHMGELLTITVLGGACFGLPTTMVGERERGVWRRYRLTPVPIGSLVASTVMARYAILLTAGLLQLALAMAVGMPLPRHPAELLVAFTFVAFAFLGLGLVIAALADSVPAVQALGQSIFLPMLILGGVAVPIASLPDWAQQMSAFFPGRYAVEAIQACVTGGGLGAVRFSLLALLFIGAAACVAGTGMFRWDAQQRFSASRGKGWIAVALSAWVAVGLIAVQRNTPTASATSSRPPTSPSPVTTAPPTSPPALVETPAPVTSPPPAHEPDAPGDAAPAPSAAPVARPSAPATPSSPPVPALPEGPGAPWQAVTMQQIDADLVFDRLPPDAGIVTPIASVDAEPDEDLAAALDRIDGLLATWGPATVEDPVQRVRNYLYVIATVDVLQLSMEPFLPLLVFHHIEQAVPHDDLVKILYWIAVHIEEGTDSALDDLGALGLDRAHVETLEARQRAGIYAVKLLGRLIGKRPVH